MAWLVCNPSHHCRFVKAGGFNGVYRGIGAAAVGSAPGAAMFFTAYDMSKHELEGKLGADK
jgi:hypothetical protein